VDAGALALVGPGRAGTAITAALVARGWTVATVAGRSDPSVAASAERFAATPTTVDEAGRDADLVVLATPDTALPTVAATVAPGLEPGSLVVHLSGASTLAVLDPIGCLRPDVRLGSLHPLQTLPGGADAHERLEGAWCAIEGPVVELAESLGMHPIVVAPDSRRIYHAAASIASNHLVALLGSVERLADDAGVPFEAFLPLVRAAVDNVAELGPAAALTGPVARGDAATVAAHLDALPAEERAAYRAGAALARELAQVHSTDMSAILDEQVA